MKSKIYIEIKSDVHRFKNQRTSIFKIIVLFFINASIRASILIRISQHSGKLTFWFWRNLLLTLNSIDVCRGFQIGKGLNLPHPLGIVIGCNCSIGKNCTIYQNVTIGSKQNKYPVLKDNVTIYPNSILVGDIKVGSNAVIGALSFVNKNVAENEVFFGKI
jgi:serine O-acetyltransferase